MQASDHRYRLNFQTQEKADKVELIKTPSGDPKKKKDEQDLSFKKKEEKPKTVPKESEKEPEVIKEEPAPVEEKPLGQSSQDAFKANERLTLCVNRSFFVIIKPQGSLNTYMIYQNVQCRDYNVTRWQKFVVRNSRHCTFW